MSNTDIQEVKPLRWRKGNKVIGLTRKQKAFADALIADKKISATKVAQKVYGKPDRDMTYDTASSIASENLRKPEIMVYMQLHSGKAENRIVELIDSKREEIALQASKDVLDRVHGKATQRIEQTTKGVIININLSDSTI